MKAKFKFITTMHVAFAAMSTVAAPSVSNVTMSQQKMSSNVTIMYDLSNESAIVTLDITTNGVSIGAANVTHAIGDVNRKVTPGDGKKIVWSSFESWPDHYITNNSVQAVVTAWSLDNPPDVMVVDLLHRSNVVFYASVDQLPYGGVTNDIYKTDQLVMRKIPARGCVYTKGASIAENSAGTGGTRPHLVAFTNDFYLGVYEVTQRQLFNVCGERGTVNYADRVNADLLPCDAIPWGRTGSMTFSSLRDWHNNPTTYPQGRVSLVTSGDLKLAANSILGKFAFHSGIWFDLPSAAQWEFACRAGTGSKFNNGLMADSAMQTVGWYIGNSTNEATNVVEPHPVGLKSPNAFGLYDMHGNVWEWVLDWVYVNANNDTSGDYDIEPTGHLSTSSYLKEMRGGSISSEASQCSSATISSRSVNSTGGNYATGFRLWAPAKVW